MLDRVKTPEPADRADAEEMAEAAARDDAPEKISILRRFAPQRLTARIVLLNLLGLIVLVAGILYFNQFRQGLIDARVQSLTTQAQIIAAAVAGSATVDTGSIVIDPDSLADSNDETMPDSEQMSSLDFPIDPEAAGPVLKRLLANTTVRARIIDKDGNLVVDSRFLYSRGDIIQSDLPPPNGEPESVSLRSLWNRFVTWTFSYDYPKQIEYGIDNGKDFPEVAAALKGAKVSLVRLNDRGQIIVVVAVPIQRFRAVLGSLVLSTTGGEIDNVLRAERQVVLMTFGFVALVTILLSILLASTFALPLRKLAERQGEGRGEQYGEQDGDEGHEAEGHQHHLALGPQHVVDLAAGGGQHERAQHGAEALDRHGDHHDDLAAVVEAHQADLGALQGCGDFGEILAVVDAVLDLLRIVVAEGPGDEAVPQRPQGNAFGLAVGRRQVGLDDVAARIEEAAVDDEVAVLVDDPCPDGRVGEQALQHRSGCFRVDREVQARHLLGVGHRLVVAVGERVGVDDDRAGVDGRRARDRGGDDLRLRGEALHARVDQALAELVEVENACNEHDEAQQVEQHDAGGEALRREAAEDADLLRRIITGRRLRHFLGIGTVCGLRCLHPVKHRGSGPKRGPPIAP